MVVEYNKANNHMDQGWKMINLVTEEFFTKKHNTLWIIARGCAILAWISLATTIIYGLLGISNIISNYMFFANAKVITVTQPAPDYLKEIKSWIGSIIPILNGVTRWLMLLGVSKGLYMILETDLNYREANVQKDQAVEESIPNDGNQIPEFYNPQEVHKLQHWSHKIILPAVIITLASSFGSFSTISQIISNWGNQVLGTSLVESVIWFTISLSSILLAAAIYWFKFGALRHGLGMLMEMEIRSRKPSYK